MEIKNYKRGKDMTKAVYQSFQTGKMKEKNYPKVTHIGNQL